MKTIKVRIPCLVDSQGNWTATNWSNDGLLDDGTASRYLASYSGGRLRERDSLVWITAEVPLPEPSLIEVEGTVEA